MILLYNLIFISLITFTILYIINKLLNVKNQSFKIISYLVIISSILVNFVLLSPIENDYSEFYLRVIVILFIMVSIIIFYKMKSKKSLLDILNNTKTTINNTEINHNYQTNIDTIDNSNTFNTSQTNNHLEQINNVTNIDLKQGNHKKQKENDASSSEKTKNILSEEQLKKIYNFFIDNNLLVDSNLEFGNFKDIFLKEPIRLKADIPTLREFYNHLCIQNNIKFKNINTDFLTFFINSKNNEFYDYKQFTKDSKPISSLTDEILELFKKF